MNNLRSPDFELALPAAHEKLDKGLLWLYILPQQRA
jgi:hypothetical protein